MPTREFNFDGIVGPTHNYSGLSFGNVASTKNRQQISNPRAAALQGLEKMKRVFEMGVGQAVLPPLRRPRLDVLKELGFSGSDDAALLQNCWSFDPSLVAAVYSASCMWTANSATVSPSPDTRDGRLHLTPANLSTTFHRSLEPPETTRLLRAIFHDTSCFCVHDPLRAGMALSDEGAANHTRFCPNYDDQGIEFFVYGQSVLDRSRPRPQKFPARQTLESCQTIARRHGLHSNQILIAQQSPQAIDAGVFHNDVISVGNLNVLLYHELAFLDPTVPQQLTTMYESRFAQPFFAIEISDAEVSLDQCVSSYLFNSQILQTGDGQTVLLCPTECETTPAARNAIARVVSDSDNPVSDVHFMDLRQSMNNGGGPACLRLRVVLNEQQQSAVHSGIVFSQQLFDQLTDWIGRHYRFELAPRDLLDPLLIGEVNDAIDEVQKILSLPDQTL